MRVCFLTQWLSAGGAERTIVTLSNELIKRGIDVDIVLLGNKNDYFLNEQIKVYVIDDLSGSESIYTMLRKKAKRTKLLKEIMFKPIAKQRVDKVPTPFSALGDDFFLQ